MSKCPSAEEWGQALQKDGGHEPTEVGPFRLRMTLAGVLTGALLWFVAYLFLHDAATSRTTNVVIGVIGVAVLVALGLESNSLWMGFASFVAGFLILVVLPLRVPYGVGVSSAVTYGLSLNLSARYLCALKPRRKTTQVYAVVGVICALTALITLAVWLSRT